MKATTLESIDLGGRKLDFRLIHSPGARRLKVRVGLAGVEVMQPREREVEEIKAFLFSHGEWILSQLKRVDQLRSVRKPRQKDCGEILYRGVPTRVQTEESARRQRTNKVIFEQGYFVLVRGQSSCTPPSISLENWLRRQAREQIQQQLDSVTRKLQRFPRKVYVRGQRTKWGNCSTQQNLSFNWRLIMAPGFVARYLVTHEVVHLAVPDHSKHFWLTVQSLCPETERAKRWLSANSHKLLLDLQKLLA